MGIFITYASIYPSAPPTGETAWGKFATIFNRILQSGNYLNDITGKVKLATNADLATNANSVPWTGVTGKPTLISTEVDPKVGTLTAGKWCTSDGSTLSCTSNAPSTTPIAPPGTSLYGGIAWQTTDTWPVTYPAAATYCNGLAPSGTWRIPTSSEMDYARVLGMSFSAGRFLWSTTPYMFIIAIFDSITYDYGYYAYSPSAGWNNCYGASSTYCMDYNGSLYYNYLPMYVRCVKNS